MSILILIVSNCNKDIEPQVWNIYVTSFKIHNDRRLIALMINSWYDLSVVWYSLFLLYFRLIFSLLYVIIRSQLFGINYFLIMPHIYTTSALNARADHFHNFYLKEDVQRKTFHIIITHKCCTTVVLLLFIEKV